MTFDPFATPFAVVADQTECRLPAAEAVKWRAVPAQQSQFNAQNSDTPLSPRKSEGEKTGFCVYKWNDEKTLPTSGDFKRIGAAPDGAVVGTREPEPSTIPVLPDSVSVPLKNTFEKVARGIETTRWQNLAKTRLEHPAKPVRVAVLDTSRKDFNVPDRALHAFGVGRVIGSLLCADPSKCDRVHPYLALPMVSSTKEDFENGGLYGTFFQLYDALSQALSDWHRNDENLVINLSLGWDPIKTDDNDPRVLRVKKLLERASCMGALIVAGAGNPTGTEGPVEPGAFEEFAAPDPKRCDELHVQPLPSQTKRAAYRLANPVYAPLLHAVGGVDSQDQRMLANRRWGQPRLAALGLNVTVPGPTGIAYTPPLSGTSMSTAIVSGIAAAVWSVLPDLDAAGVMDIVYKGGVELDGGERSKRARTEFCLNQHFGPCQETKVHRAYLCGALKMALTVVPPVPNEEPLVCDPSISTEVPVWPEVTRPTAEPAIEPCRIPFCGLPPGPTESQLVAGVTSHGGFAGCPGCIFNVTVPALGSLGSGTLGGIPTSPSPMPSSLIKMVLKTSTLTSDKYFEFNPGPTFDQSMSLPAISVATKTWGATLTWYYYVGGFWTPDPEVSLGVTKN